MNELIQAIVALLAIANPLGAAPIFLGFTKDMDQRQRRRQALRASVAVFIILAVSSVAGNWILGAFGLSFAAFQAAGGLLILLMGLEMLGGSPTRAHQVPEGGAEKEDPIMVPFAMPMIAGPGAITTVITLTSKNPHVAGQTTVLGAVAVVALVLFLALMASVWLSDRMHAHGHGILLRFMGLILAAMGAQFMLSGIHTFWT